MTLSSEFLVPLHFFGIAGNEEAQRPLLHLHVVPRVDQGAGRENDHRIRNNQRKTGVVFSRSASVCTGMLRLTSSVPSNRETESINKAAESCTRSSW